MESSIHIHTDADLNKTIRYAKSCGFPSCQMFAPYLAELRHARQIIREIGSGDYDLHHITQRSRSYVQAMEEK